MFTGFSRQQFWSGLLSPSPGDLPDPGIEPKSLTSPELAGRFFTTNATWEARFIFSIEGKNLSRGLGRKQGPWLPVPRTQITVFLGTFSG